MKKYLVVAAASAMLATPAFAAEEQFQVNADVEATCTMQDVGDVNLGQLQISTTAGNGALLLSSDKSANTNRFWVSCNDQNRMTFSGDTRLQGSRVFQPGVDDAGFTDKLIYRVAALDYVSTGTNPSFKSDVGAQNVTTRGPVHRRVQLEASVRDEDNADRPLAGTYKGTVTVTVQIAA